MMYKCENCGHLFEEGEQAVWEERHGLDTPPYEKWSGCPLCKGDYEEVHQCKECGDWHERDELMGEMCDKCIDKYKYNIDICHKIGKKSEEEIKINSFLVTMFSKEEIEEILFRELSEANTIKPVDCSEFIDSDKSWFAETLNEVVK